MKKTVALLIAFVCIITACSCSKDTDTETSTDTSDAYESEIQLSESSSADSQILPSETTAEVSSEIISETQTAIQPTTEKPTEAVSQTVPVTSAPAEASTSAQVPATSAPAKTASTKEEILKTLTDAVNKTKTYTSAITVDHQEQFSITEPAVTLDSAQGLSSLATKAVNFVKDLVLKPSQEVYSFNNGKATTSEGEETQLLLPKDKAFSLTSAGVKDATISNENGMTRIKMTLMPEETHSLSEVPEYNSSSIGYLNLDGQFSIIQIDELTIGYPGSTIDALIRADGYVQSVTYVINLEAYAKAHGMGISGSATFSGYQTEIWNINW